MVEGVSNQRQAPSPPPHNNNQGDRQTDQTARLTGDGADHGHRGKEACQALTTHDGGCVAGGQEAGQAKQAALQDGTERWGTGWASAGEGGAGWVARAPVIPALLSVSLDAERPFSPHSQGLLSHTWSVPAQASES